jgi:hypothetical protein
MLDFPISKNVVMACHITGIYDVNRNSTLPDDDFSFVKDWTNSLRELQLQGILFHNNFSEATCLRHQNEAIHFVKITHQPPFNPNVYRYFVYCDFLHHHRQDIESLFVTDVSDVVAVRNPFVQPLFINNPSAIFCGDEPKTLDNDWMKAHSEHFRSQSSAYAAYEAQFQQETLLNCGIFGGRIETMALVIEKLCAFHQAYNRDNKTAYTGDMGAFNYLIRTEFNQNLLHGAPINTVFKAYENERTDCWFRHK